MFRKLCIAVLFVVFGVNTAQAQTFHRLPLAYIPYSITSWFDHNPTTGVETRYDGVNIPSWSNYYEDGHRGTDFGASYGADVYVSATGNVYLTENTCSPNGGYVNNPCGYHFGNFVAIKHADGMVSISAHLSAVYVFSGVVTCLSGPGGNLIGSVGNSGDSTGTHLHFELRYNNLASTSLSSDPFSTDWSSRYWYDWAWVSDPLVSGGYTQYPVTSCQP